MTTAVPSEATWSETNLPDIIGQLDPRPSRTAIKDDDPPPLEENGAVALDVMGNPIKNFPNLPRHISVNVEQYR